MTETAGTSLSAADWELTSEKKLMKMNAIPVKAKKKRIVCMNENQINNGLTPISVMRLSLLCCVIVVVVCLVPAVAAATLTGTVYDGFSFEEVANARVIIDTQPIQQTIAVNGKYSFEVEPGTYAIRAFYRENGFKLLTTQQSVQIRDDGVYGYDLILLPEAEMSIRERIPEDTENIPDIFSTLKEPVGWILVIGLLVIGGIVAAMVTRRNRAAPQKKDMHIESIHQLLPELPPQEIKKNVKKMKTIKQTRLSGEPPA